MINFMESSDIESIQASLFIANFTFSTSKILKTVLDHCSSQFDGDPTVLPIPDGAPIEIPRIILVKTDKSMKLEVAPTRLNLFRYKIKDSDRISPENFLNNEAELLNKLIADIGADCVRVAVVLHRFSPKKEPAKDIAIHFCKKGFVEEPFDRPSAFELHALKNYTFLDSYEVNSWVRIKSGKIKNEKGVSFPMVSAQQDINTLAEPINEKVYSSEDISTFFKNILKEFNKTLKLYFPMKNEA